MAFCNSRALTEAELRHRVESAVEQFSPPYLQRLNLNHEFFLQDTRPFRLTNTRRLDSLFHSDVGVCVVEYKRGNLTDADITECGFTRGYFQLCLEQIPHFTKFLFVAESVTAASELGKKIQTPPGVSIRCLTYAQFLNAHVSHYLFWAKESGESIPITIQNVLNVKQLVPPSWFTDAQFRTFLAWLLA